MPASKKPGGDSCVTHGHSRAGAHSRTYNSWQSMRQRCLNPKSRNFHKYGARGITICPQWDSFEQFLADMGERPVGRSLDRERVNGNYEPGNCRWATPSQQSANTRRALVYEFAGKTLPLIEWAKDLGIPYTTLKHRIRAYGWSPERALSTPILIDRKRNADFVQAT